MKKTKFVLIVLGIMLGLLAINMLLPTKIQNPVEGCGKESYHPKSFWHPWGDHHHRGVDIFAKKGTPVHPAIGGVVISTTYNLGAGGNTVAVFSSGLHILVDGDITLREAHDKASAVEDLLKSHYGQDTHVAVHVEPR